MATGSVQRRRPEPAASSRLPARGRAEHHLAGVDVTLQVLEIAAQVARRLVAVLGPLLERALDHARERLRVSSRSSLTGRGASFRIDDSTERLVLPRKGRSRVGHLVGQDAERGEVGAVDRGKAGPCCACGPSHVGAASRCRGPAPSRCAQGGGGLGLLGGTVAVVARVVAAQLGEAEVEAPSAGRSRVSASPFSGFRSRCRIPWRCAALTASVECDRERGEALHREAARGDLLAERLALEGLHGQEAQAVRLLDRVQRHDARVAEQRDGLRLAYERLIFSGLDAISGGRKLSATRRSRRGSSARYACPIQPEPSARGSRTTRGYVHHEAAIRLHLTRHVGGGFHDAREPNVVLQRAASVASALF